jgi:hypothetical protein
MTFRGICSNGQSSSIKSREVYRVRRNVKASSNYTCNFYRVRVKLDVRKPLKTVIFVIHWDKRELLLVKYERRPNWCQVCRFMGHEYKYHVDAIHPLTALVFKDLRA